MTTQQDILISKESHNTHKYRRAQPLPFINTTSKQCQTCRVQEIKNKQIERVPGSIFSKQKELKINNKQWTMLSPSTYLTTHPLVSPIRTWPWPTRKGDSMVVGAIG